jgi:hypothetical protein
MRRREFVTLLAGAAAWPVAARAQPSDAMPRIAVMIGGAETDPEFRPRATAFERGLAAAGWLPGRNVQIVSRWAAAEPARMAVVAKELVELQPEVMNAAHLRQQGDQPLARCLFRRRSFHGQEPTSLGRGIANEARPRRETQVPGSRPRLRVRLGGHRGLGNDLMQPLAVLFPASTRRRNC